MPEDLMTFFVEKPVRRPWTPEEDEQLRALRAQRRKYEEIAPLMQRTPISVRARWEFLSASPEARAARRDRQRRRGRRVAQPQINRSEGEARPPEEVYAERAARFAAGWRSLTARLMGDPPIGRSALDRRNRPRPRLWPW